MRNGGNIAATLETSSYPDQSSSPLFQMHDEEPACISEFLGRCISSSSQHMETQTCTILLTDMLASMQRVTQVQKSCQTKKVRHRHRCEQTLPVSIFHDINEIFEEDGLSSAEKAVLCRIHQDNHSQTDYIALPSGIAKSFATQTVTVSSKVQSVSTSDLDDGKVSVETACSSQQTDVVLTSAMATNTVEPPPARTIAVGTESSHYLSCEQQTDTDQEPVEEVAAVELHDAEVQVNLAADNDSEKAVCLPDRTPLAISTTQEIEILPSTDTENSVAASSQTTGDIDIQSNLSPRRIFMDSPNQTMCPAEVDAPVDSTPIQTASPLVRPSSGSSFTVHSQSAPIIPPAIARGSASSPPLGSHLFSTTPTEMTRMKHVQPHLSTGLLQHRSEHWQSAWPGESLDDSSPSETPMEALKRKYQWRQPGINHQRQPKTKTHTLTSALTLPHPTVARAIEFESTNIYLELSGGHKELGLPENTSHPMADIPGRESLRLKFMTFRSQHYHEEDR